MSFLRKIVNPDKLLLRNYKLSKGERGEMILRGLFLGQFAIPIGSALYFLITQVYYQTVYKGTTVTWFGLKDTWDRLPVHLQNLLHNQMFGITGQTEPAWWVTARHDFRHVLIGFLAVLLVGAFGIGLKYRKRATPAYMAASVPLAFIAATAVAAAGIAFFAWHPVAHILNQVGASPNVPYAGDLIGKGTLQLTVIGLAAGFAAKNRLARTFDTLMTMSAERNVAQDEVRMNGWRKVVYGPNYRNRVKYVEAKVTTENYKPALGSRWMGISISLAAPVVAFLLAFGIWLNYFGPAAHAH